MGLDPGLVDSPPTSIIFAPNWNKSIACFKPTFFLLNFPPSEKLSGVKFNIPIILGFFLKFKFEKFLFFLTITWISFSIFFFCTLGNFLIFLILIFLFETLEIISILLKEISLLPLKGNVYFWLTSFIDNLP